MHPSLEHKLSILNAKTNDLLDRIDLCDHEILQKKPSDIEWSILQVLNHLVLTEKSSLLYISKKIKGIDSVKDVGFKQSVLIYLSKFVYGGIFRFKARVESINNPSNSNDLAGVRSDFQKIRDKQRDFFNDYPENYIDKALYRHPILGRLSLGQMLVFFHDHLRHHEAQIRRIQARI